MQSAWLSVQHVLDFIVVLLIIVTNNRIFVAPYTNTRSFRGTGALEKSVCSLGQAIYKQFKCQPIIAR